MIGKKEILTIIPIRGGSKGVLRKNIRLLNGKPLVSYGIDSAKKSGAVNRLVVATEDAELADVSKKYGAEVIKIPSKLTTDSSRIEPVMLYVLEKLEQESYRPDFVSLIQCTSPFLKPDVIHEAVTKVVEGGFDTAFTAYFPLKHEFSWRCDELTEECKPVDYAPSKRPLRQEMEIVYLENGAFYITRTELFKKAGDRFGGNDAKTTIVEMKAEDSLQIDEEPDFWLAEQILNKKNG